MCWPRFYLQFILSQLAIAAEANHFGVAKLVKSFGVVLYKISRYALASVRFFERHGKPVAKQLCVGSRAE